MLNRVHGVAVAAAIPLVLLGASAHAQVSPSDQSKSVITVTKRDASGDVRADKASASGVPARIIHSIAMRRVTYRVDRAHQVLSITYPLRRVLRSTRHGHQVVLSVVDTDNYDPNARAVSLITDLRTPRVLRMYHYRGKLDGTVTRCKRASASLNREKNLVRQAVPFDCFEPSIKHGYLRSRSVLVSSEGEEISSDMTRYTRDLPLDARVTARRR